MSVTTEEIAAEAVKVLEDYLALDTRVVLAGGDVEELEPALIENFARTRASLYHRSVAVINKFREMR